jgi:hypothetical protein
MSRVFNWQRGFAVAAALVALFVTSGLALADTPISHSGTVGPHHLRDTNDKPGVKCRYQEGGGSGEEVLYQLVIKAPAVFAVDDTVARDAQRVGWRALIQRRNHGAASFVTIAQSSVMTATAFEDVAAPFSSRTMGVTSKFGADFRVRITMYWYAADDTTVTGQATNEVDWYRKIFHSADFGDDVRTLHNYCGDYYVM